MIFKILVVDDETIMRKGITNFINWESINCEIVATAENGAAAITYLQNNPVDIIITDIKMPIADGLEVARYVYEKNIETEVILLTGYADFEYAKTAIKYNVSSFLLKPTNKKDLFEAVQTAQEHLITSKKASSIAKEELAFLKEQLLQEMTGTSFQSSYKERLNKLGFSLDYYCAAAFQFFSPDNMLNALKKIIITEKKNAYCYRYNNLLITIYFLNEKTNYIPKEILENCQEILDITHTLDSGILTIGLSQCHFGAETFQTAVSESIQALSLNFYSEENISIFQILGNAQMNGLTVENSLDLFHLENHLYNRSFDNTNITLNSIFTKFKHNFVNSMDAKNICSHIYYICYRILTKKDTVPPPGDFLTQIQSASDIFVLENAVNALMEYTQTQFIGSITIQNKLIESTVKYIHNNLSDFLSLDTCAESLHVSTSHLSRTFKKVCGESITEYINKARIEKAKEYLVSTRLLTYEIAALVGYNDATYFSSMFKKYVGVSPNYYRQHAEK